MINSKLIVGILLLGFLFIVSLTVGMSYVQNSKSTGNSTVASSQAASMATANVTSIVGVQNIEPLRNATPTATPTVDNRCIITVNGQQYDATQLRLTHSGGDVFTCGVDNTNIFFSQHNSSFLKNKMVKYKI